MKLMCLLLGQISVALILIREVQGQSNGGGVDGGSCVIPPYASLYPADITPQALQDPILLEGRCYLACLEDQAQNTERDHTYALWPTAVVDAGGCGKHKIVHECTRGCATWSRYTDSQRSTEDCPRDCDGECDVECGGDSSCSNPDPLDLWIARSSCRITCDRDDCEIGCTVAATFIDAEPATAPTFSSGGGLVAPSVPPGPVGPPTLTPVLCDNRPGCYSVDLETAQPAVDETISTSDIPPVAFLFRIESVASSNVNYIWLNDHGHKLNLAQYACQNLSVSMSVVNKFGMTSFSAPVFLTVTGDTRRIPNPPTDLQVSYQEDTRVGFFGHTILNLTWQSPADDRYVDNFTINIRAKLQESHGNGTIVHSLEPAVDGQNFISILTNETVSSLRLIMTRTYRITVTSVGADGSNSLGPINEDIPYVLTSSLYGFTCQRIWDGSTYFSFELHWSIPEHWADTDVLNLFQLELDSSGDSNGASNGVIAIGVESGRVNYSRSITHRNHGGESWFRPRASENSLFTFQIRVTFSEDILITPPPEPYTCWADATSPPPSQARDFTLLSLTVHSPNSFTANFEWRAPETANGVLDGYSLCVSSEPLALDQDVPVSGGPVVQCSELEEDVTAFTKRLSLFTGLCYYSQIRARNTFRNGNWTEPLLLELVSCTTPTTSSPTTLGAPPPQSPLSTILPVSLSLLLLLAIAVCVTFACIVSRIRRRRKMFLRRAEAYTDPIFSMNRDDNSQRRPLTATTPTEDVQLMDDWEVPQGEIIVEALLGEGAFGEVYKGILKGPIACSKVRPSQRKAVFTEVAIKLLKTSAKGSERQDFLSEIEMMKKVTQGHNPHVVGMLGCVTVKEPLCLVTEFVKYGDLLSYLRSNRKVFMGEMLEGGDNPYLRLGQLSSCDLLSFAYQIASGMEHLSSIGIVHRDLACRNILVDEGKVLKITDFGMSRETEEIYVQKSSGRVPFKWMAIESIITREFTSASDVWSYGIVLWEIGTLGGVPYPGIQNENLLPALNRGYRMDKPENCSSEIYDIMLSCWSEAPRLRPSFAQLRATIDTLLLADRKGDYIEFSLESNRMSALFEHEATSMQISSTPGLMDASPSSNSRSGSSLEREDCKLLLPNDLPADDVCQKASSGANSNTSPRLSPRRWSSIFHSPQLGSRHHSPAASVSPKSQSPKKERSCERISPSRTRSLFPGRRSPGSASPRSHSPFHASNPRFLDEQSSRERHRPASLFLRGGEAGSSNKPEDRYVKEPTKMANLTTNHSLTRLSADVTGAGGEAIQVQQLQLRRGSEGTLNMNSSGYVSFVGMDYGRDRRAAVPPPPSADIQITVTEDL